MAAAKTIPERYTECSFDNFIVKHETQRVAVTVLAEYVKDFEISMKKGKNIVLSGDFGVGKTHLAAAVANAVYERGYSVLFVSAPDFFRMVRDCEMDKGAKALSDVFDELKKPDLLIFDDMFVLDEDDARTVYEVVDARYRHKKPLILTSTLSHDDMSDLLGVGVMDRLRESSVIICCTWPSGRSST